MQAVTPSLFSCSGFNFCSGRAHTFGSDPYSIIHFLKAGKRLEKPFACFLLNGYFFHNYVPFLEPTMKPAINKFKNLQNGGRSDFPRDFWSSYGYIIRGQSEVFRAR